MTQGRSSPEYHLRAEPFRRGPDSPDGKPIILLVEQTVGGYAKIATIITPDLDVVAQAKPGDTVHFDRVDLPEAYVLHRDYRSRLNNLRDAIEGWNSA